LFRPDIRWPVLLHSIATSNGVAFGSATIAEAEIAKIANARITFFMRAPVEIRI
jgi:hypothetical protein